MARIPHLIGGEKVDTAERLQPVYNPATGDNTGEADDTFVAPGYKSVETTYNGQQAWQVIPE